MPCSILRCCQSSGSGGELTGLAPLLLLFPRFGVRTEFPPDFVFRSPEKVLSLPTLIPVPCSLEYAQISQASA